MGHAASDDGHQVTTRGSGIKDGISHAGTVRGTHLERFASPRRRSEFLDFI